MLKSKDRPHSTRTDPIQLVRGKYIRKNDPLAKPTIAALPPSLQDRCIATPGLIAEIIDTSCVISS